MKLLFFLSRSFCLGWWGCGNPLLFAFFSGGCLKSIRFCSFYETGIEDFLILAKFLLGGWESFSLFGCFLLIWLVVIWKSCLLLFFFFHVVRSLSIFLLFWMSCFIFQLFFFYAYWGFLFFCQSLVLDVLLKFLFSPFLVHFFIVCNSDFYVSIYFNISLVDGNSCFTFDWFLNNFHLFFCFCFYFHFDGYQRIL